MRRPPGLRKQATSARNRRLLLAPAVDAAGQPFRTRLWALLRWTVAEAHAAPATEQDQLLAELRASTDAMNTRRQQGRSQHGDTQ